MSVSDKIVPRQKKGTKTSAVSSKKTKSGTQARILFKSAALRLLDINNWGTLSGQAASFCLMDSAGIPVRDTLPEPGHLIRILLAAPGNKKGEGYDWVQIEQIERRQDLPKGRQSVAMRVRPVPHPQKSDQTESDHFYTGDATSTFAVIRKGKRVWAMELGRNEVTNTKGSLFMVLRNLLISTAARLGYARSQWKALMDGILAPGLQH